MKYFLRALYDEYNERTKIKDAEIKQLEVEFHDNRKLLTEAKSKYESRKREVTCSCKFI